MALPNPIPAVQGSRIALGPGIWEETFVIAPGTSDYPTNGYIITSLALRFSPTYGIMCAWVSGQNAAAAGYVPQVTLVLAQIGAVVGGAGFEGYSQLAFQVFASAGFTPAGTVAAPTVNTVNDSGSPTKALGELTGALSSNGAVTGITGVQAPAFTGTPVAAAALTELTAGANLTGFKWLLTVRGQ